MTARLRRRARARAPCWPSDAGGAPLAPGPRARALGRSRPPAAPVLLLLAIVAALTGSAARGLALAASAGLLGPACAACSSSSAAPPTGLAPEVPAQDGSVTRLAPGAIDWWRADVDALSRSCAADVPLGGRAARPERGRYRLWMDARGEVEVRLDGREVLRAEGERVRAGSDLPLAAGAHRSRHAEHAGAGARLRLGWTRPDGPTRRYRRASSARRRRASSGGSPMRWRCCARSCGGSAGLPSWTRRCPCPRRGRSRAASSSRRWRATRRCSR